MKVAAFQAPLAASLTTETMLDLVREQVVRCESLGVEILCCPEAVLGGLADYTACPAVIAIDVAGGRLHEALAPLASDTVTTIVGFTEIDRAGRLYNAAAVHHRGSVVGRYRKLHPAIRRSVYEAGHEMPVFTVGASTFGIVICRDSLHPEPARVMAARGATALFVPTNNGMPPAKGGRALVAEARRIDVACAIEHDLAVIRADVAGRTLDLVSHGSTAIVDRGGIVLASARPMEADLVVAEIDVAPRAASRVSPLTLETMPTIACPKCSAPMTPGFLLDKTHDARVKAPEWVDGEPVPSFWTGLKVRDSQRHPVTTYRCDGCGFLESYARPA